MSCLFCKNFAAVEPREHQLEREAGTCQFSCGSKWDAYTAAQYVKRHKTYLKGFCHLNPAPAVVFCQGICSKFEDGFYPAWHIGQPEERENIFDWARQTMETYLHGDWKEQERTRLKEDNEKLKAALKTARQRSAARLVKISKLEKKSAKPPKPPALRLIAAE